MVMPAGMPGAFPVVMPGAVPTVMPMPAVAAATTAALGTSPPAAASDQAAPAAQQKTTTKSSNPKLSASGKSQRSMAVEGRTAAAAAPTPARAGVGHTAAGPSGSPGIDRSPKDLRVAAGSREDSSEAPMGSSSASQPECPTAIFIDLTCLRERQP
mmetsp:Transcript_41302/g.103750  ORF Transcript_41302/g.103750 Transcript_41302/m.103750 type:complete len:156 (+) Transcript_41302:2-469(+)